MGMRTLLVSPHSAFSLYDTSINLQTLLKDILFTGDDAVLPNSSLNKSYVTDFGILRSMGDKLVAALVKNMKIGPDGPNDITTTTSPGSLPTGSCSWPGHCAGRN